MEPVSLIILFVMGTLAGAINAAVGSGSLLTLPVLLALGIPPGVSVRSNTVGILFSTIGSVVGYRREIAAEQKDLGPLMVVVAVTATLGSVLLLVSPSEALDVVVPVLIVLALVMVIFQKRITGMVQAVGERRAARRARRRRQTLEEAAAGERSPYRSPGLLGAMGAASIYGGYFTAAQGILYLGVLGATTGRSMGAVNSVKNLASLVVNLAAAIVYVIAYFALGAEIIWVATAAIALGALLGGYFGAHLAKKLPDAVLRGVIVVVALFALVRQFTG
ncbi:MAG TPA: sulfite exporter TauE/SafE family protein [Candidatus Brachybacterium merdavium]|uniref:Probable membrane transporter protein n=1 Tax=Candidatus Brachybacterium merdavium TaxID=2838513 RepID=A0A9D2LAX8_9MICO|nr:sulfite exporter TauE/SafE family protein [Candidatus Brachybacterium merdavium]